MNAVIYARYSSAGQTEQSIEGQLRECKHYAEGKGYAVIGEYVDRAFSGKIDARPDFQRMIKDSSKKLFEYVIVYTLDRFSRDKYDSANYKYILKKNGVRVVSAKENISDDPSGILLESVIEGVAQYYSAELAVKVKRGMYESFLKGQALGGTRVYGYDIINKKFIVNEQEAEVIRYIFNEYANGSTVEKIQRWLDKNKILNKMGKRFCYNSIFGILKNRKYIGTYSYGEYVKENAIQPIVDKSIFSQVQNRINKNKMKPASAKAREPYLLTHKAYCGYCMKSLVADCGTSSSNGVIHRYYKCSNKKNNVAPCEKKQVTKEWLESYVTQITIDLLLQDDMIEKIAKQLVEYNDKLGENTKVAQYEKEIKAVDSKLDNFIEAIGNGVSVDKIKDKMLELEARKGDLQYLIDEERMSKPLPLVEEEVIYYFENFSKGNPTDTEFQERIIDTFINRVILFNDKIIIVYNIKEANNDKLTIEQIIKDFSQPEKFELYQVGAVERT